MPWEQLPILVAADLSDPNQAAELFYRASAYGPIFALVNNAAIFEPVSFLTTTIEDWQRHININLTAPMLNLSSHGTGDT